MSRSPSSSTLRSIHSAPASLSSPLRRKAWCFAYVVAVSSLLAAGSALFAQQGRLMSSSSTRPPASLQRLVSPLGSAAGVRPGWYAENLGTQRSTQMQRTGRHAGQGQGGFVYRGPVYVPYPVYPAPQVVVVNEVGNYLLEAPQPGRLEGYRPSEPREDRSRREARYQESRYEEPRYREPRYQEPRQRRAARSSAPAPTPQPVHPVTPPPPRHEAPQAVVFQVQPSDARIYLDGEPLGTASTLEPLALDPGVYVLEVEHDTHDSRRLVFGVTDSTVQVAVDLSESKASRRVRVR